MTKTLLLNLDGALTDPKTGITASIQYARNKLGFAVGITSGIFGDFRTWIAWRNELVPEYVLDAVTH